jgi:hypothetical protein
MTSKDEKLKSVLDANEKDGPIGSLGLLLAIVVGLVTLGNLSKSTNFIYIP